MKHLKYINCTLNSEYYYLILLLVIIVEGPYLIDDSNTNPMLIQILCNLKRF